MAIPKDSPASGGIFDLEKRKSEIKRLERKMQEPGFWDDPTAAHRVLARIKAERALIERFQGAEEKLEELSLLLQLAEEEKDVSTAKEVQEGLKGLGDLIGKMEMEFLLGGEDDPKNALLTIHPGAGGTESQDWAQMLMRMYMRWIEKRDYQVSILDLQPGDEAGIKNVTIEAKGEYAYGYLKAESGVHRLVRISPFDANRRRHTSFASVWVYPEVEDSIEVEIEDSDLRVETFRASGAGGQHVNKTSSAVRITHLPTGIVVQCQSERSQHRNRENAIKVLRARLYRYYQEEKEKEKSSKEGQKKKIEWGSQIRSYVFHPYSMVKDHRTGLEKGNVQAVMDGDIDEFIEAWLRGSPLA